MYADSSTKKIIFTTSFGASSLVFSQLLTEKTVRQGLREGVQGVHRIRARA